MAPPPPPPPPPALCLPFFGKKPNKRLADTVPDHSSASSGYLERRDSSSSSRTLTSTVGNLTFVTDSEKYDEVPQNTNVSRVSSKEMQLARGNTATGTKTSKWGGYGWGLGKKGKNVPEQDLRRGLSERTQVSFEASLPPTPEYDPPTRSNTRSTNQSRSTVTTQKTRTTTQSNSMRRNQSYRSHRSADSGGVILPRPPLRANDSSSTLVGSALERKMNAEDGSGYEPVDTTSRLNMVREHMEKEKLDYYVVPTEDAHLSETTAKSEMRRKFMTGFSGSNGQAIVSRSNAYLITDSRYWIQAEQECDSNWRVIRAGAPGQATDWIAWIVSRGKNARVGIDARMISYEKAVLLSSKLNDVGGKVVYPSQNFVDFAWVDKPRRPDKKVKILHLDYTGEDASSKLAKVRKWIRAQPPDVPTYYKTERREPKPTHMNVGTILTALDTIAYTLNLRGSDVPYNPLFYSFLFIGLNTATLFIERVKLSDEVLSYLDELNITVRPYSEIWSFLRRREWGEGKIIIAPETPYVVALLLSHFRTTVLPSFIAESMTIKNQVEIEGARRAYLRDGAAFVIFLSWLEEKIMRQGYDITEFEASAMATEFRYKQSANFMGTAYENISASGPNAALPHYHAKKATARVIDKNTPYLLDAGGQWLDGTCDTTRTVHFGRPDPEMIEAYTRVLQGHIAIDTAVFPEGTSGRQLDILARRALWKDGLNYMHGTGHGFGSYLTVHEGSHGFSSDMPLKPGHVVTNEPGFYREGHWGMRIESALVIRRTKTRSEFNGNVWLNFERLTCVPIQTRMVKESMLTKEEKQWIKDHNQKCLDRLGPLLKDNKLAMKWLRREAERGIGLAAPVAGGIHVEWD